MSTDPQDLHSGFARCRLRRSLITPLALLTALLMAPHTVSVRAATAGATTSIRSIEAAAEQAVRTRAGANARKLSLSSAPLDPRLRLAACDRPLDPFIIGDGEVHPQTTVGVRCAGSVRWTIYDSVTVESTTQVLVARYALPRDAMLTALDFDLQTRRVPGMSSTWLSNPASLTGQRLRTPVGAGQPLSRDALAPAPLIRRGQQVTILARGGGIEVRMAGVALADGRESDHIRVQNVSSQRVIEAIIRSDSVVEAPL